MNTTCSKRTKAEIFLDLAETARRNLHGIDLEAVLADIKYRIDCEAMDLKKRADGSVTFRCYDLSCINVSGDTFTLANITEFQ